MNTAPLARRARRLTPIVAAALLTFPLPSFGASGFGTLGGDEVPNYPTAMNASGAFVVGYAATPTGDLGFYYTPEGGTNPLSDLTGLNFIPRAVAANATTIVGAYNDRAVAWAGGQVLTLSQFGN